MKKYIILAILIVVIVIVFFSYLLSRTSSTNFANPNYLIATISPKLVDSGTQNKLGENEQYVESIANDYRISYRYPRSFTAEDPKFGTDLISPKGKIEIVLCSDAGPNFESKENYKPSKKISTKFGVWDVGYLKQDLSYINGKPTQDDINERYIQAILRSSNKDSLTPMLITAYFKSEDDKYFADTVDQIIASFTVDGSLKNCSYRQ
jgi:hypothetical protein